MDNVIVDFKSGIDRLPEDVRREVEAQDEPAFDDVPGIFSMMDPMPGAIEGFTQLAAIFDTYILSTAPWNNPSAWSDKLLWVKRHFGAGPSSPAYKRLILSHHKNLNAGDFIIDDRTTKGVDRFGGTHIHFGTPAFPDWAAVCRHLMAEDA
jgi:5'(3')-deoxyribonucleotidase